MAETSQKTRIRGFCKWWNDTRGYGRLEGSDGNDYFIHYQDIVGEGFKTLEPYQEVEFLPDKNAKGLRARDVRSCK